jgi:hypothetical protein
MTFQPNVAMPRAKALTAIEIYKDLVATTGQRAYRVFSERRTQSRKIKFWGLSMLNFHVIKEVFIREDIPFYITYSPMGGLRSIAFNVPLDVTVSNPLRSPV